MKVVIMLLILNAAIASANGSFAGCPGKMSKKIERVVSVFQSKQPVIAMLHLAGKSRKAVVETALQEMALFEKKGVEAVIVENYHGDVQDVINVLAELQGKFPSITVGVNILPNEYDIALELAHIFGAKFIQMDFVSGAYGSKKNPTVLDLKKYEEARAKFPDVFVMGGVWPKYYRPVEGSDLTADLLAAKKLADAVVVTGSGTGMETPTEKIKIFRKILGPKFPLIIGAGVTLDNVAEQLPIGQGLIIGSYFKDGNTKSPAIPERVDEFMTKVREVRGQGVSTTAETPK